jgi:flagella basal body P-ring formation protein FlgA
VAIAIAIGLGHASEAHAESPAVERVRTDLERFVAERIEDPSASVQLPALRAFDYDLSGAPGEIRTELSSRSATPFQGRVSITVALYAGDVLVKRAVVSPYVEIPDRVLVAKRPLARGQVVSEDDLVSASRDRADSPPDAARDLSAIVGLRTKRGIAGNQVVRNGDFEAVPIVERGDRVVLVLIDGPLMIQAAGLARETGASGEWIRVVNLDSKRELTGRVDREGRVHVAF